MTDIRNVTIIGLMGRLNMLIDEGAAPLTCAEVKERITQGTILQHLGRLYGDFPEFAPINLAERHLLLKELRTALEIYDGREESKMGVSKSGLCLLLGYCIELLMQRHIREIVG